MLFPEQQRASDELSKKLDKYGLAIFVGEIRSGKSRSFLDVARNYKTLVITKKDSMSGVLSEAKEIGVEVDVINYHSVDKMNPDDYELICCDESHLYISQATPKASTIWKKVVLFTKGKLCIFASGTITPEGYGGLYRMLALSSYSPFRKYVRFTQWFNDGYGIPSTVFVGGRQVAVYKKTNGDKIKREVKHLVVKLRRKETGHEFESEDVIHEVGLNKQQKKITKALEKDLLFIKGKHEILGDTPVKMLGKLHQVNGGISIKGEDSLFMFKKEPEKVKYIKKNFDTSKTMILSYYKHEQDYLAGVFEYTGSVTKLSTGVDLSHYETLVIYSMAFSASNYEQVRGRLMNVNRKTQMKVHYLLSGEVDKYIMKAVKSKESFTSTWFKVNR